MTTLNFTIANAHTTDKGNAVIVEDYSKGIAESEQFFTDFYNEFKTNKIGNYEVYSIYENYVDSASDDYFYFAVKN